MKVNLQEQEPLELPEIGPERARRRSAPALAAALWTARAILAVVLATAGALKVWAPAWTLMSVFPWIGRVSPDLATAAARLAGVAELAAAVAVALPPWNAVVAGLSRVALSAGGAAVAIEILSHVVGDGVALRVGVAVAGLAAFVAWGRVRT